MPRPVGSNASADHAQPLPAALDAARAAVCTAAVATRVVQQSLTREHTLSKSDHSPVTIADFAAQAIINHTLRTRLGTFAILAEESSATLREPEQLGHAAAALEAARLAWPGATMGEFLDAIDLGCVRGCGVYGAFGSGQSPPAALPPPSPLALGEGATHQSGRMASPVPSAQSPVPSSFWTLDPIDGTKGFIRGHQYSICLALVENGRVVLAALACPNLSADFERPFEEPDPRGTCYLATEGGPVLWHACDDATGPPRLLAPAQRAARAPMRLVGSFAASHQNESTSAAVRRRLGERGVALADHRKIDSQCKYAVVARGQADVFLRTPRKEGTKDCIWDHAPGSLIARRAGCVVTDTLGNELDFGRGLTLSANAGILAGWPEDHARVLAESRVVIGASEQAPITGA